MNHANRICYWPFVRVVVSLAPVVHVLGGCESQLRPPCSRCNCLGRGRPVSASHRGGIICVRRSLPGLTELKRWKDSLHLRASSIITLIRRFSSRDEGTRVRRREFSIGFVYPCCCPAGDAQSTQYPSAAHFNQKMALYVTFLEADDTWQI